MPVTRAPVRSATYAVSRPLPHPRSSTRWSLEISKPIDHPIDLLHVGLSLLAQIPAEYPFA